MESSDGGMAEEVSLLLSGMMVGYVHCVLWLVWPHSPLCVRLAHGLIWSYIVFFRVRVRVRVRVLLR